MTRLLDVQQRNTFYLCKICFVKKKHDKDKVEASMPSLKHCDDECEYNVDMDYEDDDKDED